MRKYKDGVILEHQPAVICFYEGAGAYKVRCPECHKISSLSYHWIRVDEHALNPTMLDQPRYCPYCAADLTEDKDETY